MASVIDTFLIEIALDPSKFTTGQKAAIAGFKATTEEAMDAAKKIEAAGERASMFFSALKREVIGVLAIFTATRGVKEFIQYAVNANIELGRLSARVGIGVATLSQWETAGFLAGDKTNGVAQAFAHVSDEISKFKTTGETELLPLYQQLSAAGGKAAIDIAAPLNEQFVAISENLDALREKDPVLANYIARQIVLNDAFAALLVKGPAALKATLDAAKELGYQTEEDAKAAARLWHAWASFETVLIRIGNTILDIGEGLFGGNIIDSTLTDLRNIARLLRGESVAPGGGNRINLEGTTPTGSSVRVKSNAGEFTPGTSALAGWLQNNIPGFKEITAANDAFHAGTSSRHAQGLALDFTLADASKYEETVAKLKAIYGSQGASFGFHPKGYLGSTGDHIHASFASKEAADRFAASHNTTVNIGPVYMNGDRQGVQAATVELARRMRDAAHINFGPNH